MPRVNSYTNWGKLEEVWLGDCYPAHFYDHLESEVRDIFYEITEKTKEDLHIIQRKMEEFDVVVQRPSYNNINDFLNQDGVLEKPQITPRDHHVVIGNKLIASPGMIHSWDHAVNQYRQDIDSIVTYPPELRLLGHVCGANSVRAGKDIYLDLFHCYDKQSMLEQQLQEYHQCVAPLVEDYRVHLLFNGGHVDGCFAIAKPGLIITSQYFTEYEKTFPRWSQIIITNPEFYVAQSRCGPVYNGKWWDTTTSPSRAFNNHIIKHALNWVGNYTETYFEVNCLVIDEKNILMLGENDLVFRELERHGITAHSLPFRTRTFWDGGLHCLTLDIRRQDTMIDLFPDRDQPLYLYDTP
jgi:hypothetical protein